MAYVDVVDISPADTGVDRDKDPHNGNEDRRPHARSVVSSRHYSPLTSENKGCAEKMDDIRVR